MDRKLATYRKTKLLRSPMTLPVINLVLLAAMLFFMMQPKSYATSTGFYLDTLVSISVYGQRSTDTAKNLADLAIMKCGEYDRLLSRTVTGSDLFNINNAKGEPVTVSPETYELLKYAVAFADKTNGALDPTILSLDNVWDISSRIKDKDFSKPLPDLSQIADALSLVDYRAINFIEPNRVSVSNPESGIDLGFIAKGYIADKLKEFLVEKGVKSGLINLGGNIVVWGKNADKKDFTIGIQSPELNKNEYVKTVTLTDKSIVTSGTYERFFSYDGKDFPHIFDTATGYPVTSDLVSATIIAKDSYVADALSTLCIILGADKGLAFIEGYEGAKALFIKTDGTIIESSSFGAN